MTAFQKEKFIRLVITPLPAKAMPLPGNPWTSHFEHRDGEREFRTGVFAAPANDTASP